MSRVRKGAAAPIKGGGIVVQSTGDGTLRGMRCARCQRMVSPSQDAQKKTVYKCACGSTFSGVRM